MLDPIRLLTQLQNTGLANKDNPLFQLFDQIIKFIRQLNNSLNALTGSGGSGGSLFDATFLMSTDQSVQFPNSRELLAGTGVTFDDTVANERTISVNFSELTQWSVLTNGDAINPELVFASGDVIMTHTP